MEYTYKDLRDLLRQVAESNPNFFDPKFMDSVSTWSEEKLATTLPQEFNEALRFIGRHPWDFGGIIDRGGPFNPVPQICRPE